MGTAASKALVKAKVFAVGRGRWFPRDPVLSMEMTRVKPSEASQCWGPGGRAPALMAPFDRLVCTSCLCWAYVASSSE